MKKLILLLLFVVISGCEHFKEKVDLIIVNANVYLVDENFGKAQAFAVHDGKFLAVGTNDEIRDIYTSDQLIDADGRTITPGLIDAHCHFYGLGLNQQVVNLVGTTSFDEVLQKVRAFHNANPKSFLRGRGWDQNDWEEKKFPTKAELDTIFPDIPVVLERVDGHAYLVNQKALDMAGIDWSTKVDGGEIQKKWKDGFSGITGVLIDNPMLLIDSIMPLPTKQEKIKALKDAERICLNHGLTTVNDAGIDRETIELIDSLQQAGDLSIRIYAMVSNNKEDVDYFINKGPVKTDLLNVRSVKVYGDGALGSRGAALKQPYSDLPAHYGAMVTSVEELNRLANKLAISEYQMNTHAIGDSANIAVLRAYKKVLEGTTDRRWKIEHAQVLETTDFDLFKEGIIPSVQPTHATSDMYWVEDRLGDRVKGAYAYKTLLNKAGMVALGTDFPVEDVSPFLTFYAAVGRRDTSGYPEDGFHMEEALTREEALKGMTIWAAYSNFEENEKGSIEPGKFADFVIYSEDLMTAPLENIPNIRAEQTFVNGIVR
ncbi:hypothetical protein SAMN04488009_1094 [Maribacter sedimenticola]|uniref:Amidohydrolase 3 domain-containing protein n=1 Tax=Maribacter sedimenticola TaxID=228956 RepID=A0ABY1SE78_9FLAO|nr:amidohydrolase [Maribacter sedimenticola]SNR30635.1 hypothetical protein SAMN04488009_1094 [Maribacter sedimenticola]